MMTSSKTLLYGAEQKSLKKDLHTIFTNAYSKYQNKERYLPSYLDDLEPSPLVVQPVPRPRSKMDHFRPRSQLAVKKGQREDRKNRMEQQRQAQLSHTIDHEEQRPKRTSFDFAAGQQARQARRNESRTIVSDPYQSESVVSRPRSSFQASSKGRARQSVSQTLMNLAKINYLHHKHESLESRQRQLRKHNILNSHVHLKFNLMPNNDLFGTEQGFRQRLEDECNKVTNAYSRADTRLKSYFSTQKGSYGVESDSVRQAEEDRNEDLRVEERSLQQHLHIVGLDTAQEQPVQSTHSIKHKSMGVQNQSRMVSRVSESSSNFDAAPIIKSSYQLNGTSSSKQNILIYMGKDPPKKEGDLSHVLEPQLEYQDGLAATHNHSFKEQLDTDEKAQEHPASRTLINLRDSPLEDERMVEQREPEVPLNEEASHLKRIFSNESLQVADHTVHNPDQLAHSVTVAGHPAIGASFGSKEEFLQSGQHPNMQSGPREAREDESSSKRERQQQESREQEIKIYNELLSRSTQFTPINNDAGAEDSDQVFIKVRVIAPEQAQRLAEETSGAEDQRDPTIEESEFDHNFSIKGPYEDSRTLQKTKLKRRPMSFLKPEQLQPREAPEAPYQGVTIKAALSTNFNVSLRSLKSSLTVNREIASNRYNTFQEDTDAISKRNLRQFQLKQKAISKLIHQQMKKTQEPEEPFKGSGGGASAALTRPLSSAALRPTSKMAFRPEHSKMKATRPDCLHVPDTKQKRRMSQGAFATGFSFKPSSSGHQRVPTEDKVQKQEFHKQKFQMTSNGAVYLMDPSYFRPFLARKKLVENVNVIPLKYDAELSGKNSGKNVVSSACKFQLFFQPADYSEKRLKVKLLQEQFKRSLKIGIEHHSKVLAPIIQGAQLKGALKKSAAEDADSGEAAHESSESEFEESLDKVVVYRKLLAGEETLSYGCPIKFKVKQNLKLVAHFKKESNKLRDLSEFKRQVIDFYLTTDTSEPVSALNCQVHKQFNFNFERNGYGKEYEINPVFHFTVNLPDKEIKSSELVMLVVGERACELAITATFSVNQSLKDFTVKQRPPGKNSSRNEMDLTAYYDRHRGKPGDGPDLNFVNKNISSVKDMNGRKMMRRATVSKVNKLRVKQSRATAAESRRLDIENSKAEVIQHEQCKWERYKQERERLREHAVWLVKNGSRSRNYLIILQIVKVVARLKLNYEMWKQYNKDQVSKLFISVKMSIAFKLRFYRRFGMDFKKRQVRVMQRHFSLIGHVIHSAGVCHQEAAATIEGFLQLSRFRKQTRNRAQVFIKYQKIIVKQWRRQSEAAVHVKERAYERFEYEVDYLIWFYQRAERMYSINKKKVKKSRHDGGCGLLSSHKQVKEILCRLKELKDNLEFGNTIQRNLLLDCLLKRMQCEYMLDYTIWRFVKNRQRIADIEAQPHHKDIQKRMQERIHLINEQKRMLDSFKTNQIKIYQSDQLIFANTHLVERDHLFAIDGAYEEQKSRPASSKEPAPRKSQMITKQMFEKQSGPGKQKEEAGDHLAVPTEMSGGKLETHEFVKFNYSQYVKKQTAPQTHRKYELQDMLVKILMDEFNAKYQGDSPRHTNEEEKERLLAPFVEEDQFPRYIMCLSRENFQRCVVKCAKLDTGQVTKLEKQE